MSSEPVFVESIASSAKNSIVGGPFGSNLVSKDYVPEGVPVIRGQNMGNKWVGGEFVFVSEDKASSLEPNKARPGDLIFTQRGTLGQVAIVPDTPYPEYIVSQSQMKLSVDPQKADVGYLYYAFLGPEQQEYIRNNAIQTGVPHTNLGILKKTPITLPLLAEQQKIAGLLGALDDRIALLRETNATLEAIAQALFKSWFVDFDPVHARARGEEPIGLSPEVAALFPASFEESALGMIPEGWLPTMLGDVCKFQKGCSYKGAGLSNDSGAYMFNLGCFNGPRIFAFENIKRYTGDYKPRHEVVAGDLIVANTDMTQMRDILGRPLIVPSGYEKAFISHHVFRVEFPRLEEQKLLRNFLFFAFGLPEFRERAVGFATGTTVLGLPKDALDGYQMVVPAKEVLAAFNKVCEPILAKIEANHHTCTEP